MFIKGFIYFCVIINAMKQVKPFRVSKATYALITEVFRLLRKQGFVARQNFMDTRSSAWAEIPEEKENVVFYTSQDKAHLKEYGELWLHWDGNGSLIRQAFQDAGAKVVWNGRRNKRIKVVF